MKHTTKDIIILLDTSGSMNGIPIFETEKAINMFSDYVRSIDGKKYRCCVLGFNDNVYIIRDFNEFGNYDAIHLSAYGGTNLESALKAANDMICANQKNNKQANSTPVIIIISDGYGSNPSSVRGFVNELNKEYGLYFLSITGSKNTITNDCPNIKEFYGTESSCSQKMLMYMINLAESEKAIAA